MELGLCCFSRLNESFLAILPVGLKVNKANRLVILVVQDGMKCQFSPEMLSKLDLDTPRWLDAGTYTRDRPVILSPKTKTLRTFIEVA